MRPIILHPCFFTAQDFIQHLMSLWLVAELLTLCGTNYPATRPLSSVGSEWKNPKDIFDICRTKYPATRFLPECRWQKAELRGEKNFLTLCGTKYPARQPLPECGWRCVWQNSEERRILDSLLDQIPRNTTFT
jgi:hypothetical protein